MPTRLLLQRLVAAQPVPGQLPWPKVCAACRRCCREYGAWPFLPPFHEKLRRGGAVEGRQMRRERIVYKLAALASRQRMTADAIPLQAKLLFQPQLPPHLRQAAPAGCLACRTHVPAPRAALQAAGGAAGAGAVLTPAAAPVQAGLKKQDEGNQLEKSPAPPALHCSPRMRSLPTIVCSRWAMVSTVQSAKAVAMAACGRWEISVGVLK